MDPVTLRRNLLHGVATVEDLGDLRGASVLVRCDLNTRTPVTQGALHHRLSAALPTLEALVAARAQVTVACHVGENGENGSTTSIARALEWHVPGVTVLKNLRSDPGETSCDASRILELVDGHDAFVNDAFGTAHRRHASIIGPPRHLPSAIGPLMHREVEAIDRLMSSPEQPFVAICGGNKVAQKLDHLVRLAPRLDHLFVGGVLCVPFLALCGRAPLTWADSADLERAELITRSCDVSLPVDLACRRDGAPLVTDHLALGDVLVDIGPRSAAAVELAVLESASLLWNGPLGIIERAEGRASSLRIVGALRAGRARAVVGGGETTAFAQSALCQVRGAHLSTGGGSLLYLVANGDLPALQAIRDTSACVADDHADAVSVAR